MRAFQTHVMNNTKIYIVILAFCTCNLNAQRNKLPQNLPRYDFKKMHFGFTIGINSLDFKIKYDPDYAFKDSLYVLESNNQKGFNLGIVSNFRLGRYTDIRFIPALVFGERHLIYSFNNGEETITDKKMIESTLIDFPIHLKYKSERYNNFRSYVILGIKYSLDIASQKNIIENEDIILKLKPHDLMGEIGFGMDFYLEFFKFSPEVKINSGILNLLIEDNTIYTKSVKRLSTNGWMLSFTFE